VYTIHWVEGEGYLDRGEGGRAACEVVGKRRIVSRGTGKV
jgi:hypothetical protein